MFLGANTLSIGSNNLDTEFSGVIRNGGPFGNDPGGGGITKAGTGTLTLSGSSSYTRHTTVTAGTLIVNGSITSSASVNGGTLGGTGTMLAVNVENGGTVAPGGAGTGILTVSGNLSLGLGATYLVEVNGVSVGTEYDQTSVAGAVSLAGATLSLNLGFQPAAGMSFIVIDNDGTEDVAGTFAGLSEGSSFVADGQTFAISYAGGTGNDVVITAAVPEPATWLLLVGGAASLGISVRQQRSL